MTVHRLPLSLNGPVEVAIGAAVIAGWTGRDRAALRRHIAELEELGVKPPVATPVYYRVAARRLTSTPVIEVSGDASSGEVEFVLLRHSGRLWIGVGSDHTDRTVETYDITVSKQMCDKPVAPTFWAFDTVAPHWDRLVLRSWIEEGGARVLYQEGPVSAMLAPLELLDRWNAPFEDGMVMFGGTLAAIGGIRPSNHFAFELEDPVTGRRLSHGYDVRSLAMVG